MRRNKIRILPEIKRTGNLIKRRLCAFRDHDCGKLTGEQGMLFGYIMYNCGKEVFQRDIEREFSLRRSTATVLLRAMEDKGMIQRVSVDYDARLKRIEPTQKGCDAAMKMFHNLITLEQEMCAGLSEEEINTFLLILAKMTQNLSNNENDLKMIENIKGGQ